MISSLDLRKLFNGQQRLFILGLLAVNLLVFGTLGVLVLLQRGRVAVPLEVTTGSGLALNTAQAQALELAQDWQHDAQLIGVTTTWEMGAGDSLTLSRPAWSFSFYSPLEGQVQLISVDHNGAHALRQLSVQARPGSVQADWNLDSGDLLLTFMAYGGKEFLKRHGQVSLHFRLVQDGTGRSIWHLRAIDPATQQSLTVNLDALSRQVIQG